MASHMPRTPEPELMDLVSEAEAYARADFSEANQAFVEGLVELAGPLDGARAVDLGTGPGDIPIRLAKARPDWRITAVDASESMLAIARAASSEAGVFGRIDWVLSDAKATELPAGGFDVVFSNSLLHHLPDPEAVWSEIKRLAAPGATVFLRDLARPCSETEARGIVETYSGDESELLKEEFYRSLLAAWTVEEVRSQLDATSFPTLTAEMVSDRHLQVSGRL